MVKWQTLAIPAHVLLMQHLFSDIVDTEPAEGGDVYKAMLGPVDDNYNGDSSPSTTTAPEDKV